MHDALPDSRAALGGGPPSTRGEHYRRNEEEVIFLSRTNGRVNVSERNLLAGVSSINRIAMGNPVNTNQCLSKYRAASGMVYVNTNQCS